MGKLVRHNKDKDLIMKEKRIHSIIAHGYGVAASNFSCNSNKKMTSFVLIFHGKSLTLRKFT